MGAAIYGRVSSPPRLPVENAVFTPTVTLHEEAVTNTAQPWSEPSASFPEGLVVNVPGLSKPAAEGLKTDSPVDQKDLILLIEATERSWIVAHIDDQMVKEVLLQPGERIHWQAKTKFVLTLGNAGGVKLELDGKTLDPLGPSGKVVKHITLTR
jgi:hypothetical protein